MEPITIVTVVVILVIYLVDRFTSYGRLLGKVDAVDKQINNGLVAKQDQLSIECREISTKVSALEATLKTYIRLKEAE